MKIAILALLAALTIGCQTQALPLTKLEKPATAALIAQATPTTTPKPAYYCGAITKAGTACKHRVKVQGTRCFQHQGK